MLLYYSTQTISQGTDHGGHMTENSACMTLPQVVESQDDLILPKKVPNPVLESSSHRSLHRELLLSHKWGLLPEEKPELQRVLEQRRLEQHKEREEALRPRSDLERKLRKRKERLLAYELEEMKRRKDLENVPEFVRVRENLRHIQVSGY